MDSKAWDERYRATGLVWGAGPNRFVVEQTEGLAPGRALDLAAGEGRNAVWLAERGWRVTAVDFSPVAVERGRRIAAERGADVEWAAADVRAYTPEPGGHDLVLLAYLHLPAEERRRVLAHAVRALAPGGRLVSVGHDRSNIEHGTGGPQDPAILHDAAEIAADLTAAAREQGGALHIGRAGTVRRPVRTEDGEAEAIDTLVVAERPADPA
ncbi:class I SAM-dependent methyltransferase [Nocardiopsis composta]|uniref:SAM-dependent methyltransferase n=1 Tax=Nocardiopsis composta TaxID=157465 RepID=A0A7W8QJ68_9ACTN|nr:class I SAM-dependent methyltransferase [Nocardiopsis composta]MBB5431255.1 SAM-dependent methyltransferase [Nocardiopsis composta]